ncbi:regulator of nonsense transcripts 1 homolog [Chelonus insularis]|uniref:regulator of nonsense transcripts 1 homolog n=1 Tax=Chelonus insularis TaxID=460826 RepID=UPI00158BE21B|nr:regulator of nonsense transcripts 1 homolog [Chelonus insularis]
MFLRITTNDSNKENKEKNLRDEFFNHVLKWNPDWFRNKKYQKQLPDVVNNIKLTPTKLHYKNVDEYQQVMFPQLIHEYWCTLQKDYEAHFKDKRCEEILVEIHDKPSLQNLLVVNHFTRSTCCFSDNKQECTHPRTGDLVELFINRNKYFAYVTSKIDVSITKNLYQGRFQSATIVSITFLEPSLGMIDGLNCLGTFPLCKSILSPNAEQYRMPSQLKLQLSDIATKANPNPSQLKVISGIIEAIEQGTPKICLVQGPPGTGKSNTIVNLIASMIKRNENIRFLVCAASNKAVDSLALQLIKIKPTLEGQNIPFLVVRVGNREKIDEGVKGILLETLADQIRRKNMSFEETNEKNKETILMNSQVITSTLASCYTKSCMRKFFSENSLSEKLVCIIDEAAQANELLTLIPLLLGVKFLFLVGDHQQLEPVVLSQTAKRYGYNSSLFARAQKIFREEKKNPIAVLDTQYRMEKSISCWPNKYFYQSRLKDAALTNSLELFDNLKRDFGFKVEKNKDIEVNTVDSFQGSERDIIIMSCVRSHELGFTGNPNRLNVSITRAKHTLIMLGNFQAFERNSMWSNLIRNAEQRNVLVHINDDNAESIFEKEIN